MRHFEVRRLAPGDHAGHHAMLDLFGTVFEEEETYGARRPDDGAIDAMLANPHFIALVATTDTAAGGRVIGALCAYVLPKFEQPRSELYIYDLAVDADWRRLGVATALIEALQPIAREHGAWVIYVQADHGDDPAIALYTGLGTREDVLHFDIPVRTVART